MEGVRTPAGILYNGTVIPALCLDLDGTIRHSKTGDFINGPDDVALFPDVEAKVWKYRNEGYLILGISNQGGVAFGFKTPQQVNAELDATFALFNRSVGDMGPFHMVKQCFHMEGEGAKFPFNRRSLLRKPDIGMLALMEVEAFDAGVLIDWAASLFVGDREEDKECAARADIPFQWAKDFFGRSR